jgi:hypothetical protein
LIDHLAAPRAARRRVRVVLATIAGDLSITAACSALGVRRTRFFALRQQVLRGAIDAVVARPRGRPRRHAAADAEVRDLQAQVRELDVALRATLLRSEIALTMPFLLDRAGRVKKTAAGRAPTAHPRRARGALATRTAR